MPVCKNSRPIFITVLIAVIASACAGITPSQSIIAEVVLLNRADDIPETFNVGSITIDGVPRMNREIQDYMKLELKNRGFLVEEDNPVAIFRGHVRWSSHAISGTDISLHMDLQRTDSGNIIWACEIKRKYDVYSSLADGIKGAIEKSIDCLSQNIQALSR